MSLGNFGVAGLGVMGQNFALNLERNGLEVIAYNRAEDNKAGEMRERSQGKNIYVTESVEEFVRKLEPPRRIMLLVTAGPATDAVIDSLTQHMEPGDIIIDGGNSHFPTPTAAPRRSKREDSTSSAVASPAAPKGRCGDRR